MVWATQGQAQKRGAEQGRQCWGERVRRCKAVKTSTGGDHCRKDIHKTARETTLPSKCLHTIDAKGKAVGSGRVGGPEKREQAMQPPADYSNQQDRMM